MQSNGLKELEVLFVDIDRIFNFYNSHFARQFSVETARSFCELHPDKAERHDFEDLVEKAVQSYKDHGRTTAWFAKQFKIDEMELYQHHHDTLCEQNGFIDRAFRLGHIKVDDELNNLLAQVTQAGVQICFFTNGRESYAHKILGHHGIDTSQCRVLGIDSFGGNKFVIGKESPSHICDALHQVGAYRWNSPSKGEGYIDINQSHAGIIDDTADNIRASNKFNMVTIQPLKGTTQSQRQQANAKIIVNDINDLLRRIISSKASRKMPTAEIA